MGDRGAGPSVADADVVFVPAHPVMAGGRKDVGLETRQLDSGQQAAIAFTSLARLVDALGQSQPWVAIRLGKLRELVGPRWIAQVAVDPSVPAAAWRWQPDDVSDLEKQEP